VHVRDTAYTRHTHTHTHTHTGMVPVANAFLILFLVTCIYATLATHLFGHKTGGEAFFGSFSRSIFSMIQVLTADCCASAVRGRYYIRYYTLIKYFTTQVPTGDSWAWAIPSGMFGLYYRLYYIFYYIPLLQVPTGDSWASAIPKFFITCALSTLQHRS